MLVRLSAFRVSTGAVAWLFLQRPMHSRNDCSTPGGPSSAIKGIKKKSAYRIEKPMVPPIRVPGRGRQQRSQDGEGRGEEGRGRRER